MVKKGGIPWNKGKPAWNRGMKWSDETRQRISEGVKRNHPAHGPNGKEFIEKIMRWRRLGIHRDDCQCCQCSEVTRRKMSMGHRNRRRNDNMHRQ